MSQKRFMSEVWKAAALHTASQGQLSEVMEGAQGLPHRSNDCTVSMMSSSQKSFWSRGLCSVIDAEGGVVLLVDEIDKADFEFESLLLEVLSDFKFPHLNWHTQGTVKATCLPHQ